MNFQSYYESMIDLSYFCEERHCRGLMVGLSFDSVFFVHCRCNIYRILTDALGPCVCTRIPDDRRGGSTLGQGVRAPRFTCCLQIQKLAERSDVISDVPKCSKFQIFRGSAPDPADMGELTAVPQTL